MKDDDPGPAPTVTAKKLNLRESMSPLKKSWHQYINVENSSSSQLSPKHPQGAINMATGHNLINLSSSNLAPAPAII
jgi:hypothetical protein